MIYVLIRGRNCQPYIEECLKSIDRQTYNDVRVFLVLDAPEDQSYPIARNTPVKGNKIKIFINETRMGLACNIWYGMKFIEKYYEPSYEDVIAVVDGDDYLHKDAFKKVMRAYKKGYLCTYGSYIKMSKGAKTRISQPYHPAKKVRQVKWHGSHLKTFKYRLWQYVPESYFKDDKGNWGEAASDLALMFCIMELAGLGSCFHIQDATYYWRDNTPFKTSVDLQKKWEKVFRKKEPLQCLKLL